MLVENDQGGGYACICAVYVHVISVWCVHVSDVLAFKSLLILVSDDILPTGTPDMCLHVITWEFSFWEEHSLGGWVKVCTRYMYSLMRVCRVKVLPVWLPRIWNWPLTCQAVELTHTQREWTTQGNTLMLSLNATFIVCSGYELGARTQTHWYACVWYAIFHDSLSYSLIFCCSSMTFTSTEKLGSGGHQRERDMCRIPLLSDWRREQLIFNCH